MLFSVVRWLFHRFILRRHWRRKNFLFLAFWLGLFLFSPFLLLFSGQFFWSFLLHGIFLAIEIFGKFHRFEAVKSAVDESRCLSVSLKLHIAVDHGEAANAFERNLSVGNQLITDCSKKTFHKSLAQILRLASCRHEFSNDILQHKGSTALHRRLLSLQCGFSR